MDSQLNNTMVKKTVDEMTDDEVRAYFASTLEWKGWRRETAGEDWEPVLEALLKAARAKRGILATGAFGCGKTSMIKALVHLPVVNLAIREELERIDSEGSELGSNYHHFIKHGVVLDDLGAECPRNEYGVKRDVAGEYITAHHLERRSRLYITTNLTPEQIYERYGGRVADRLKELCVPLVFKGKSKRSWTK